MNFCEHCMCSVFSLLMDSWGAQQSGGLPGQEREPNYQKKNRV